MNCKQLDDVIGEFLNGVASSVDEAASAVHLRACQRCRRRTAEILAVHELLIRQRPRRVETQVERVMVAIEQIEESLRARRPGRAERVQETIETLGVSSGGTRAGRLTRLKFKPRRKPSWFGAIVTAAAVLVVAGILTFFVVRKAPPPSGQPMGKPATVTDSTRSGLGQIARIAHVEAAVSVKRRGAGALEKAIVGLTLSDGDTVETGAGRARIEVGAEAVLYANDHTVAHLSSFQSGGAPSVLASIDTGEVYVDEDDPRIHVETPDGRVTPRGTRFNVRRTGATTQVVVRDGSVEVRAKPQGTPPEPPRSDGTPPARRWVGEAVVVNEGNGSQVTQGVAPSPPTIKDVKAALGWIQETRQPGRLLCAFESTEDLKIFENLALRPNEIDLVRAHATGGTRSLKVTIRAGATLSIGAAQWLGLPSDWSGYGVLAFDVQAKTEGATTVYVDIRDARNKGLDFKQRSVQAVPLRPGANSVRIPLRGLKTNDGTRPIELGSIWMLLIGWEGAAPGDYYIDSLMLTP